MDLVMVWCYFDFYIVSCGYYGLFKDVWEKMLESEYIFSFELIIIEIRILFIVLVVLGGFNLNR